MAELIEVMSQIDDDSGSFTVNTAVNSVDLNVSGGLHDGLLRTAQGGTKFIAKDNFIILSAGCNLPIGFEFWENDFAGSYRPSSIRLYYIIWDGSTDWPLSNPRSIWFPFENYEMNLGVYNKVPTLVGENFWLKSRFNESYNQKISMVNVPASLDGLEFHVPIFVKILHTIPLLDDLPPPPP